jgi:hypothetical protein
MVLHQERDFEMIKCGQEKQASHENFDFSFLTRCYATEIYHVSNGSYGSAAAHKVGLLG